ncbi:hypothetical protein EDC04DRAFT_2897170 [Pisolithus marmoratus]|nr:hypothetical protein EDC04DRAFT_2897170 [Pisolithus marmoratus]
MVLIDEEAVPLPAYYVSTLSAPPPFPTRLSKHNLERQRKTLYWLANHLTLVNHAFSIGITSFDLVAYPQIHLLPSLLFAVPPHFSDLFSMTSATSSVPSIPPNTRHECWTSFIAIKTRGDLFTDASELHLCGDKPPEDLFDLTQPRSRLEDLVRHYGMCEGVVLITSTSAIGSSSSAFLESVNRGSSKSQD